MTKAQRRRNRKKVLEALHAETGSFGGEPSEQRFRDYVADPEGARTEVFSFLGALTLRRFFIAPDKPNKSERRSLWQRLMMEFLSPGTADPGGWSGQTNVSQLQLIVEGVVEDDTGEA